MNRLRRLWEVFDDRTGTSKLFGPVIAHPVPDAKGWVGWSYALGSAVLFSFVLQVVTGIALASAYIPSTGDAYESLRFITEDATLGGLLRGMHNYGATLMIITIGLHMIQTYLVGAYKFPREVNWLSGVALLGITLGLAFTGQLLRWDQTAYWSVFVLASQAARTPVVGEQVAQLVLAGNTVGGATLTRFYAFHVFFLPALIFGLLALHLWLVIHNGVSEPPEAGRPVDPKTYRSWYQNLLHREGVPFWPDALWRDVVLGLVVLVIIIGLAVIVGPPKVDIPPDPTVLEAYPRPDWYFLWIFAALALVPPGIEDLVILGMPLLIGTLLIALPFISSKGERSPKRRPWALAFTLVAVIMIGTLYVAGERAPWSPEFNPAPLDAAVLGPANQDVTAGAQLFNQKGCQSCHAVAGDGGKRGPDLTFAADRLTREQIIIRILNGGGGMPAYAGTLSPEELQHLTAFMETRRAPPVAEK
ncbi:MAG: cytochrome b N-terminal domain-containing protein [Chloroflexia bacterium]